MHHGLPRLAMYLVLFCGNACAFSAEPADTNYDESLVPAYQLPDPLLDSAGRRVDLTAWKADRRAEVLRLFEDHVYGQTPRQKLPVRYELVEQDQRALSGKAIRKQVAMFFGEPEFRIDLLMYVPRQAKPAAGFVGLNFKGNHTVHADPAIRQNGNSVAQTAARGESASRWQVERLVERGYALITLHRDQVDPDNYRHDFSDGIHPLFYADGQTRPTETQWGAIGAWAWSLSRTLDYLATDPLVDARRLAVVGHSRLGKTALWAAAQDQRFAMAISNNSGCGGAALYRRCYGERLHHMLKPVGYWFCRANHQYAQREHDLPVDQHMLMALVAPRPLYVASATEDRWADPRGEFLAAVHASPVYELYGKRGLSGVDVQAMPAVEQPIHTQVGYHLRKGRHDITAHDWEQYLAFADRHLAKSAE